VVDEQKRIENELEGTSKEACRLGGHSVGRVVLPAASLLAMKLGSYYDCKAAPAVLQAFLDFAVAGERRRGTERDLLRCQLRSDRPQFLNLGGFGRPFCCAAVMPVAAQLQRRCTRSAASGSPSIARTIGAMSMILISSLASMLGLPSESGF
jgi:hypothetical protein